MAMRRDLGLVGLTFVAVGGVLGSGWLFAPLLAAQAAGPAALISWGIGAASMLLIALAFAEVSTLFPVAGGIARIPQFSHGRLLAMALGWSAWAGYCTTAPIEVEAALRYASTYLPWLHEGGDAGGLTTAGYAAAFALLALFTLVNAFGVAWFARINTTLTWFKLAAPVIFIAGVLSLRFEPANFSSQGFAPEGISGIFGAVATGGVVFAFVGFRHAIDMAGETANPQRNIPLALILAVLICLAVYGGMQTAFIGGLSPQALSSGWAHLDARHEMGPLAALATALGALWLVSLLNAAAVASPFGGALVATGSNGRLAMAMAENGVFPGVFARLNAFGVPLWALCLNFAVAATAMVALPFAEIVTLHGAALVLSFVAGPVAVLSLRQLAADRPRGFRMPAAPILAPLAFVVATLMIYWSGWETTWRLMALLATGLALFALRLGLGGRESLDARGALWLAPYLGGLALLSWLGGYGGGAGLLAHPWDTLAAAALAALCFALAQRGRLDQPAFDAYLREELTLEAEEYGETPQPAPKSWS